MGQRYCYDYPRPALTVDVAVFRPAGGSWEILLIRRGHEPFANTFALPGGFVDENEPIEHAARRELLEETAIEIVRCHQLRTYGDPGRDPRGHVVSVAHCVIVGGDSEERAGDDASEARWFAIDALPALAFDHDRIVADAIEWLVSRNDRRGGNDS